MGHYILICGSLNCRCHACIHNEVGVFTFLLPLMIGIIDGMLRFSTKSFILLSCPKKGTSRVRGARRAACLFHVIKLSNTV